jgi:hypothetical protein
VSAAKVLLANVRGARVVMARAKKSVATATPAALPATPTKWPYVSLRLEVVWLPNERPWKDAAIWIGHPGQPPPAISLSRCKQAAPTATVFYRWSALVCGRLHAALDKLPRDDQGTEARSKAHAILQPLYQWLFDRYTAAADVAGDGTTRAEWWQALDDEIADARRAPAIGKAAVTLPVPTATQAEIRVLERIDQQDRNRVTDAERRWRESWGREAIAVESDSDSEAEAG